MHAGIELPCARMRSGTLRVNPITFHINHSVRRDSATVATHSTDDVTASDWARSHLTRGCHGSPLEWQLPSSRVGRMAALCTPIGSDKLRGLYRSASAHVLCGDRTSRGPQALHPSPSYSSPNSSCRFVDHLHGLRRHVFRNLRRRLRPLLEDILVNV